MDTGRGDHECAFRLPAGQVRAAVGLLAPGEGRIRVLGIGPAAAHRRRDPAHGRRPRPSPTTIMMSSHVVAEPEGPCDPLPLVAGLDAHAVVESRVTGRRRTSAPSLEALVLAHLRDPEARLPEERAA
ncbi:hypothetical protein AV521_10480 [Streptomyces sp. IMTB 2501]|uniref:hypothetical protein n=1 Tax=Streptomyces sp. IMTB 2501 TaxID=1776340 RepID=UPI00096E7613|nr:hypothetical protein [Streptomyces sp. IMTB 2501]OLZ71380.1 hypothetical protein AV521_10480 [Streptomyces sp. IMTB 2501]